MHTFQENNDSFLLHNGLAIAICSLGLLMAGVVFGNDCSTYHPVEPRSDVNSITLKQLGIPLTINQ